MTLHRPSHAGLSAGLLTVTTALLVVLALSAPAQAATVTTYFLGQNYGTKSPADRAYAENDFSLLYPEGGCPLSPRCDNTLYPVVVVIRGGNSNNPLTDIDNLSTLGHQLLDAGFVVAIPSYHVVDLSIENDYLEACADLGRMVQYLRRFRTILNVDPDRVFALGHSGGGFYSYYLGLNDDYQDLGSNDLVERESSRPNFIIPWGSLTDWECVDFVNPATNPTFGEMFLDSSDDAKLLMSPTYWLYNAELYGRSFTPPMCLVYSATEQNPCGVITDFHDGHFGTLMLSFIERYCGGNGFGQSVCTDSTLIGATADVNATTMSMIAWMVARAGL